MRQINDRLNAFFQKCNTNLIEQDGERDGQNHTEDNLSESYYQRIPDHPANIRQFKHVLEMLESDHFRLEKSQCRLEILECHNEAQHRNVVKNKQENKAGNDEHMVVARRTVQSFCLCAAFDTHNLLL